VILDPQKTTVYAHSTASTSLVRSLIPHLAHEAVVTFTERGSSEDRLFCLIPLFGESRIDANPSRAFREDPRVL